MKAENNDAVLASIGTTITDAFKWKLTSDGKLLSLTDESLNLTVNTGNPTAGTTYAYTDVFVRTSADMTFDKWTFTPATGMCFYRPQTGAFYNEITVTTDDGNSTMPLSEMGYALLAYNNGATPSISWTSSNTSVVIVHPTDGTAYIQKAGKAVLTGSFTATKNGVTKTYSVSINMDVKIARNMYYSKYDPTKYEVASTPTVGSETAEIRYRMNCYGYAFSMIRYGYVTLTGNYGYKQQPGEFAATVDKSKVKSLYSISDDAELMSRVVNNMKLDADRLGYSITEYIPESSTVEQFGTNNRLIALVTRGTDYHFYVQHSDGNWSHKTGSDPVSNKVIGTVNLTLTNSNICNHACRGPYLNGQLKFFIITKSTVIDTPHGSTCCHNSNWPCNHSQSTLYLLDQAGDYMQNSKNKVVGTTTGRIDFRNDHDVYCFTPTSTKSYTIKVNYTTGTGTDLDCCVYNEYGEKIGQSTATGNALMSITLTKGKVYYIDIYNFTGTLTGYQFTIS